MLEQVAPPKFLGSHGVSLVPQAGSLEPASPLLVLEELSVPAFALGDSVDRPPVQPPTNAITNQAPETPTND
jgi:hypothetical protein